MGFKHHLALQKKLTKSVKDEMHRLIGDESPSFRRYYNEYRRVFRDYQQLSSLKELLADVGRFPLLLVGDFHSCFLSQKSFLKLIQNTRDREETRIGVVLECLREEDADAFQDFRNGVLSKKDFLQAIQWERNWGFPFEHHEPVFQYCFQNQLPIFPLRPVGLDQIPFEDRDAHFARRILQLKEKNPDISQWFVLVGDLHLAPSHLPNAIQMLTSDSAPFLTIYQNSESIYWKLASYGLEHKVDVVLMEKNAYCINGVPPWIKYQTYVQWLRNQLDESDDDPLDERTLFSTIDSDHIWELIQNLSHFLHLPIPPELDHFETYTANDLSFIDKIRLNRRFSKEEVQKIQLWVSERDSLFIPRDQIFVFPFPKPTQMAHQASIYLHHHHTRFRDIFFSVHRDFYRFIMIETIGYIGSKLMNPKIKCNLPQDFERMLHSPEPDSGKVSGNHPPLSQSRKRMIEIILAHIQGFRDARHLPSPDVFDSISIHNERPYYWIACQLGRLLGEYIYDTLNHENIRIEELRELWLDPLENPIDAYQSYSHWLSRVRPFVDTKQSKRARI